MLVTKAIQVRITRLEDEKHKQNVHIEKIGAVWAVKISIPVYYYGLILFISVLVE